MADEALRPRTKDERRAWLAGYADAVLAVADGGFDYAVEQLRVLADAEVGGEVVEIEVGGRLIEVRGLRLTVKTDEEGRWRTRRRT